jgi:Na+/proline symporter
MNIKLFALIIMILFFGGMIWIGMHYSKKDKAQGDSDNFILAGREAPLIIVAGSLFATWVSSATIMGYCGTGYSVGISGYWSGGCFMVATMWLGIWIVPKLRRSGITTVPEFMERYFGAKHRIVALVLSLGRDLGVIASITIALAMMFMNLFGIGLIPSMIITVGVVALYTASGGMWAVLVTDTIQAIVILVGTTILIPIGIIKAGGIHTFNTAIPAGLASPWNAGVTQSIGWFLMGCFITFGYQTVLQRGLAAKDDRTAKRSFFWGGMMALIWYIVPFLTGVVARVIYPNITPTEAYMTLANILGPYAGVFFVVVLMASAMSTISACILTSTSNFTLDLYKRFINPQVSDKKLVRIQRICLVVIVVACAFIGKALPYILELFWVGGRIMAGGLAPVFLLLILWPRSRRAPYATFWAMISGAGGVIAAQIYQAQASIAAAGTGGVVFLFNIDPVLVGLPICFAVLIIGVFMETRNQTTEYLEKHAAHALA